MISGPSIATALPSERVQRFKLGDEVDVVWGGSGPHTGTLYACVSDPLNPPGFEHCSGVSARYLVTGRREWVYDWQLRKHRGFFSWLFQSLLPFKA
jgi:hypothetical protein